MVDRSDWLLEASADQTQGPLPHGPARMRVLPRSSKETLAQAAAEGKLGKSASKVKHIIGRFQQRSVKKKTGDLGYVWLRLSRYWGGVRDAVRRQYVTDERDHNDDII